MTSWDRHSFHVDFDESDVKSCFRRTPCSIIRLLSCYNTL